MGSLLTLVSVMTDLQDTWLVSQRIVWCKTKPHESAVRNAVSVVVVLRAKEKHTEVSFSLQGPITYNGICQ